MMRKKIYLVLLFLSLFFLTSFSNPVDKFIKDVKKEVSNSVKNTSSKKIKESIIYINDNYNKKIDKNFVYHTLLLEKLCDNAYLENSKIQRLSQAAYEYMFRQSKGNTKELEESLAAVNEDLDNEVNTFYEAYQRSALVTSYLSKAKTKLLVEAEEKGFVNINKINKALDYIRDYYDNGFKNNEVTEYICYYSLYLEKIGNKISKSNDITKLGKAVKKYMQEGRERSLKEIEDLLNKVNSNRDALIGELVSNN